MTADNLRILYPSPLDTIVGHIMQDTKDEGDWKKLSQRGLIIIDGSINSYSVHLNSPAWMYLVRQANYLVTVLAYTENDRKIIRDA